MLPPPYLVLSTVQRSCLEPACSILCGWVYQSAFLVATSASIKLFASAATLPKMDSILHLLPQVDVLQIKASRGSLCYVSPRCKGSGKSG